MIPIIISGVCGRMGGAILDCALEDSKFEVVGALESPAHPSVGDTVKSGVCVKENISDLSADKGVLIEFTTPEATMKNLAGNRKAGWPAVIGTTALSEQQEYQIEQAAKKAPIVYASNMSVGVNLLFQLAARTAKILGADYDVEIFETHHRFKKDSPSGTAKTLAQNVARALELDEEQVFCYGRQGITDERPKGQIGIHAMRTGDVVGEHTVVFGTKGERIELTHKCHSRKTFALGALRAAEFAWTASPGLYDMRDVLGLKQ